MPGPALGPRGSVLADLLLRMVAAHFRKPPPYFLHADTEPYGTRAPQPFSARCGERRPTLLFIHD
jgi:hypothetical protein